MNEYVVPPTYAGYRFPAEVIAHTVWLSCRFALRDRDVEELLAERGIIATDESIRRWTHASGHTDANALRRRRPRPGDTWPLDEVLTRSSGRTHSQWRAVDQEGNGLDILVQSRRDQRAAVEFLRKLLKGPRTCRAC